jgi:hypothetical protein
VLNKYPQEIMGVSIKNIGHTAQNKENQFRASFWENQNCFTASIQGKLTTEIPKLKPLLGYADNPSLVESPN